MLLYKRYLLKKIIGYFLAIATILISLIWFTRAISFIKYITENGISISSFFYLFVLILPWIALLVIPISLFIAILISYGRLNASNELTILKNSGLSKTDIARPAIMIATFLSLVCYMISFYLMPIANKKLKVARVNFQNNYANILISPGIFESLGDLTIYVAKRDQKNRLSGILLYNNSEDNPITLTAQEGDLVEEDGSLLMRIRNGTLQKYNIKKKSSEILNFDSYVVNLTQNKDVNYNNKWRAQERSINELLNPTDLNPNNPEDQKALSHIKTELHQRFTYPLLSLVLAFIACAYILKGEFNRRGSLFNNIGAIVAACVFIAIATISYDLIERSERYFYLLYGNFVFFFLFSSYLLRGDLKNIKKISSKTDYKK